MFWFDDFTSLGKVLVAGLASYVFLILALRISGKRTLSQLNIFDFVITVAFGSTMATAILSASVPIVNGLAALGLLIAMQWIVARASQQWGAWRRLVKSEPRLLYFKGAYDEQAMHHERIVRDEILQAVRSSGIASMDQVAAVVLETNGNLSVLKSADTEHPQSTLENVRKDL